MAANIPVAISVRPEAIALAPAATGSASRDNCLRGTIVLAGFLGNMQRYKVAVGELTLQVTTGPTTRFDPGTEVDLSFPVDVAVALPD